VKFASLWGRSFREGEITRVCAGARRRSIGVVLVVAVVAAAALAFSGRASAADVWSPNGNNIPVTVDTSGTVVSPSSIPLEITTNGSERNKIVYVSDSPDRKADGTPARNIEATCTSLADHTRPASGNERCPLDVGDLQFDVPHYWWVTYLDDSNAGALTMSNVASFTLVAKEAPTSTKTRADAPRLRSAAGFDGSSSIHDTKLSSLVYKTLESLGSAKMLAVACWDTNDWESVVTSEGMQSSNGDATLEGFWMPKQPHWLHLAPDVCTNVQRLIDTHQANGRRAQALTVVIHESLHAHGVRNEAQTNCYAVQFVPAFAYALGMKPATADYLGELAVRYVRATAPSNYWNAASCRDGGTWDLYAGNNLNV